MKTLKTILAMLLCLSLAAGLAACSGEKTKPTEEPISGGWSTGKPTELTDEQKALFEKAFDGFTGVSYTPVLYLGQQVVAGYNHRILCKAQAVVPGAAETWAIVEIYEDLEGKAEVTGIQNLTDEQAAQYGVEPNASDNGSVQIANPFIDCESLDAAEKIAGFAITVPETVEGYPNRMIQAVEKDMIQVFYTTGDPGEEGTETVLLRKAVGSADVSGDYNEYASVISQELRGRSVTLKGDGKLIFLAIWTEGDYSYSVSVSNGMTSAAILDLVNALK